MPTQLKNNWLPNYDVNHHVTEVDGYPIILANATEYDGEIGGYVRYKFEYKSVVLDGPRSNKENA